MSQSSQRDLIYILFVSAEKFCLSKQATQGCFCEFIKHILWHDINLVCILSVSYLIPERSTSWGDCIWETLKLAHTLTYSHVQNLSLSLPLTLVCVCLFPFFSILLSVSLLISFLYYFLFFSVGASISLPHLSSCACVTSNDIIA